MGVSAVATRIRIGRSSRGGRAAAGGMPWTQVPDCAALPLKSAHAHIRRPFSRTVRTCRRLAVLVACTPLLVAPSAKASDVPNGPDSTIMSIGANADTSTRSDRPRSTYGRATTLSVRAGRTRRLAFLRFALPARPGRLVLGATLRIRATSPADRAVVALRSVRRTQWRETTLAWRNQPPRGPVADRASGFAKGSWVSFDATRLVRAARHGRVVMALVVASASGSTGFASREARRGRPRLVVRTGPMTAAPSGAPTVAVAGDIADDGSGDTATSNLVVNLVPDLVLTAGDNAYQDGSLAQYQTYYDPTWGRFKSKTRPAPGNHEYHTSGAAGYFDYFNGVGATTGPAGTRGQGYYSFDVGAWHLIALNNYVSMSAGSAQEQWLKADLSQNTGRCTLAYWHEPRFTSGAEHSNNTSVGPLWNDLYAAGADLVLNGHNHQYERFAPQDPSGNADATKGIREFVVGTGGAGLYAFGTPQPNSEVRDATANGVLELTLHQGSYDWSFVPVAGESFTDSGTAACHSATPSHPLRGMFFRQSNGGFDVQVADGFNLIDSTPSEVSELPAGVKGPDMGG